MITSELLPGFTLMVLFGLISGRSTGSRLLADLVVEPEDLRDDLVAAARGRAAGRADTVLPCSLASASGTTLYRPSVSTTVKPCRRSAASELVEVRPWR